MTSTGIVLEDLAWPALISLLASLHLVSMARRVGLLHLKFKIQWPSTSGDPFFDRSYRAHQNAVEFFGIFLCCLWTAAIFFHPIFASIVGVLYIYGRERYYRAYQKGADKRFSPFFFTIKCLIALAVCGFLGLVTTLLRHYAAIDLSRMFFGYVRNMLPHSMT